MSDGFEIQAWVDRERCIGSGPCFVLAPRAFALDESMRAVVLNPQAESYEVLLDAALQCPTQAIYLSQHGESLYP